MELLTLIITGGNCGAEFQGLVVAQQFGIPTSGWMPKDWKTQDGAKPEYQERFGMKEHSSSSYKDRTWANVEWACGTIRLASNFQSPGEVCTLNAIKHYGKPYYDVHFDAYSGRLKDYKAPMNRQYYLAARWIEDNNIKVLNIAGNSRRTNVGIEGSVNIFLTEVFRMLGYPR